eukprot:TRINITY_DN22327_c0_g1_i1.p1 TRINITY_DN22327_c0_g1~~TRINITY_DN22327_c0_g1_i1.p1  ORF type:complete len:309 (+),score=31.59 TRINITY_DN22327_c0_g1_i1:35-928(+)
MDNMELKEEAILRGHSDWVTDIKVGKETGALLTCSRDRKLIFWKKEGAEYKQGKELIGHQHYVESCALSNDEAYAMSASGDYSVRLWDVENESVCRKFEGHTGAVIGVDFSADNRMIITASRDRTIKIWNTLGQCKWSTPLSDSHTFPISSIALGPKNILVTGGYDKNAKVWDLKKPKLLHTLPGHTGRIDAVAMSPDGLITATGGGDKSIIIWDVESGKELYRLDTQSKIHALIFFQPKYWVIAATTSVIMIFDLEKKELIANVTAECRSLASSADGTIFAGLTDGSIHIFALKNK